MPALWQRGVLGCSQSYGARGQLGGAQGRSRRDPESWPRPAPVLPSSLGGEPHPRPSSWGPCCPWLPLLPSLLCDPALACPSAPKGRPPSGHSQLPLPSGTAASSLPVRPLLPPAQMPPGTSPAPSLRPAHVAPAAAGGTWLYPYVPCADSPLLLPVRSLGAPCSLRGFRAGPAWQGCLLLRGSMWECALASSPL